jgi:sugar phosphate isomerase/epimerase
MRPSIGLAPYHFALRRSLGASRPSLAAPSLAAPSLAALFLTALFLTALALLACGASGNRPSSTADSRSAAGSSGSNPAVPGSGSNPAVPGSGSNPAVPGSGSNPAVPGSGAAAPRALASGAAGAALPPISDGAPGQRHLSVLGIQLYTLRARMQQDFEGTLRSVAGMGYREVEFAGLFGHDPSQVRQLLGTLGLSAVGSHVDWKRIRDDSAGAIAETLALGAHYLVFAYLPDTERRTLAQWQNWVLLLNQVGQACKERGLELAYHNHDFEFTPVEGVVPYDLLLEQLDHRLVEMEIDLYWVAKAGRDPIALFEAHPGIFPLGHVKDLRRSDQAIVEVGQGDLDFAAVFARADLSGMQHFIVEHDNPADPLQTARNSQSYLEQLRF